MQLVNEQLPQPDTYRLIDSFDTMHKRHCVRSCSFHVQSSSGFTARQPPLQGLVLLPELHHLLLQRLHVLDRDRIPLLLRLLHPRDPHCIMNKNKLKLPRSNALTRSKAIFTTF